MTALLLLTVLAFDGSHQPSVVVVVGAEGTEEYGKQFREWAGRWQSAAEHGDARAVVIGTDDADGPSDRELLQMQLAGEQRDSQEPLWLVLIGHGTFDGRSAKFNLRGPDVSATELAEWLKPFDRPLAIVNCSSSSGPFLNELSGPNRVVITATKSGFEHNFARFGDYISKAMVDPKADLDKDEQTSLLEAFLLAVAGVGEFYSSDARLETEHALLDDNGDKLGTPADWFQGVRAVKSAKDGASPDGIRANQFHLIRTNRELELSPELRVRRDELEKQLAIAREKKSQITEHEYLAMIEPLLQQLAELYEQAEQASTSDDDAIQGAP